MPEGYTGGRRGAPVTSPGKPRRGKAELESWRSGRMQRARTPPRAGRRPSGARAVSARNSSVLPKPRPALIVSAWVRAGNLLHQPVKPVKPGGTVQKHKGALAGDRADPVGLAHLQGAGGERARGGAAVEPNPLDARFHALLNQRAGHGRGRHQQDAIDGWLDVP